MTKGSTISALLCIAMFSGAVGSSMAQTTAGIPVIVDARNTVVGPAFGQGVILSVQGSEVYVDLSHSADGINYSATELSWGAFYSETFATTDCSGPPLIPAANGGLTPTPFKPAIVVRNGNTVTLYIAGTSAASNQQYHSYGLPSSCSALSGTTLAYSVGITVNNLTQLHPEPLHVR